MEGSVIRRTLPLAAAVLLGAISIPRAATAGDVALAEALFRQGRELMDKGDYAAACPKLKESFAQDEATGTLLALALCQEQAGQTASAWATYAEVVTRARRDGRADREQAALEQLQGLDPKLSRLTIEVDPSLLSVAGAVVKRDGLPIGTGAWGVASPVDPGVHVVEATAPGKRSWKASVTIKPVADAQVLKVPPLVDEVLPAPAPAPVSPPEPPRPPPTAVAEPAIVPADSAAPSTGRPLRTLGLVVGGAGIVGLGASGFFAIRAKNLDSESKDNNACDQNNACTWEGLSKRNDAVDAANAATIALVAGGVLTAAGVTLVLVGGSKDAKRIAARVEAKPSAGPGVAVMFVQGLF
jgi:hypothetical protein